MPRTLYVTTTLPYINADPHIGFAFELVSADIFVRANRLAGREVFFNTGTDEHGLKIYRAAEKEGKELQEYVDGYAAKFKALLLALGISPDINFIRTSDARHKEAAGEFWQRCRERGFIYKKKYQAKYCVGCELPKTDSELDNGKCPLHPKLALETIDEENYFFKFSAFEDFLKKLYADRPDFVVPDTRFNEIKAFVARGLQDFSISRLTEKQPWGISVPDDETQTMYVWFDALVNYISAIGWPFDKAQGKPDLFEKWWIDSGGVVQFAGKDQVRQQAAMWQAMLHAADLSPSRQIVIHGFITSGGQKMSKSLGNVVDPFALVNEYGTDAVRWFLARHMHPFEDSDFTLARFKEAYNADLANGVGNLVSRILKMAAMNLESPVSALSGEMLEKCKTALERFDVQAAAAEVSNCVSALDKKIQETKPFELVKKDKIAAAALISELVRDLYALTSDLEPILPQTTLAIRELVKTNKSPAKPLFPRRE
ncbi:MAG: methionine--tRNA ligase [Patescibacteria group bacterium]